MYGCKRKNAVTQNYFFDPGNEAQGKLEGGGRIIEGATVVMIVITL